MTPLPAGLDIQALRRVAAARRGPGAYRLLLDRIAEHLDAHDGYVSWSGGKDSTVVLDLARQVDPHVPVVFFDSGLQFPETIHYVQDLADRWKLNFHAIAPKPDLLTLLVADGGFDHDAADRVLPGTLADIMISRPAAQAHEWFGPGSLWGVREDESVARARLYRSRLAAEIAARRDLSRSAVRAAHGGVIQRVTGTVTYGPIWDWDTEQVFTYLAGRHIEPNPLYAKMARLGVPAHLIRTDSIISAALLANGHIAWLQKGWPHLFDQLAAVLPRLREWT